MFRVLGIVVLMAALSACAQMPQWSWPKGFANLDTPARGQAFNFDWQLSGDPQIAPLQVFDDARRTWLQFAADQAPPALFRHTERGDILLQASREGAYLVLDGVWPHVLVRGGHLVAHVRRATPDAQQVVSALPLALSEPWVEPVSDTVLALDGESTHREAILEGAPITEPVPGTEQPTAANFAEFRAGPEDGNLRLALVRWAGIAGWTFGPEHWVVDVDIPLTGAAVFGTAFKPAVRHLLAATELGDRPLQPCFYANQVLRIVPFAQRCDRSLAPGAV